MTGKAVVKAVVKVGGPYSARAMADVGVRIAPVWPGSNAHVWLVGVYADDNTALGEEIAYTSPDMANRAADIVASRYGLDVTERAS